MFVGTGTPRKPVEREQARNLRRLGMPIKRIAARLGVSPSSVLYWTEDILLTPEQRLKNLRGPTGPQSPDRVQRRVDAIKRGSRARRLAYQREGRERAREEDDPLHRDGCMLYWAEGAKDRNSVGFSNSDPDMLAYFRGFLVESLGFRPPD